jgi:hypothetical protein
MRKVRLATLLYPRAWRKRYAREFAALLEQTGDGWRDAADVALEGMKMRIMSPGFRSVAAMGLAGLVVAVAIGAWIPNRYMSNAVIVIRGVNGQLTGDELTERVIVAQQVVLSRTSLKDLIQQRDLNLYADKRCCEPLEDTIERMKSRDIKINIGRPQARRLNEQVLSIGFSGNDPAQTSHAVEKLMEAMNTALGARSVAVEVLDPPSLPVNPIYPNRPVIWFLGLIAGLTLSVVVGFLRGWTIVRRT